MTSATCGVLSASRLDCKVMPLPFLHARLRKQDPKHSTHSGGKTHFAFNSSNLTSFAVKPWNGTNLRKPLSQAKRMVGDRQDFPFLSDLRSKCARGVGWQREAGVLQPRDLHSASWREEVMRFALRMFRGAPSPRA